MESVGCEFLVLYRNSLGTLISFLRPILYYLSPDPHIQPRTSESRPLLTLGFAACVCIILVMSLSETLPDAQMRCPNVPGSSDQLHEYEIIVMDRISRIC
jgi:hypothetical protein